MYKFPPGDASCRAEKACRVRAPTQQSAIHTNGCSRIFVVGEEIGATSALRYHVQTRDSRISGVALMDPVDDPDALLRERVGDEVYAAAVSRAGVAARQGAGMDVRIDLLPDSGPTVTQYAPMFLGWWGPTNDSRISRNLEDARGPLLILADTDESLPETYRLDPPVEQQRQIHFMPRDEYGEALVAWSENLGAGFADAPELEPVQAESGDKTLFGLLWAPADGRPAKTAVLLMHGLTSSPLSSLFTKMAPVVAQGGTAVLAMESRRSGFWGHETALADDDLDDIDAWIQQLVARGYERIVLVGASMGSLSIGRYQSMRQNSHVIALAHLMPTADCPEWFREAAGHENYENAVATAKEAISRGRGHEVLIDVDVRQPPPSLFSSYFRWTQRAASWLSWWGPDADTRNSTHFANAKVPLLLLAGTDDSYNDEARFAELRKAAVNAPSVDEIWYPGVDHGLAGVEAQVARDLLGWLRRRELLECDIEE